MLSQHQLSRAHLLLGVFIALSFVIPTHLHPYRTFYQDAFAIFGVLLTFAFMAAMAGKIEWRIPSAVFVPLGLIVVIAIQTANGLILYSADMVFPVIYFLCLILALILGATLAMQEDGLTKLAILFACTFLAVGVVCVVFQHVQVAGINAWPFINPVLFHDNQRPFANVAQPNLLALVLCFSVVSVWYLYLKNYLRPRLAIAFVLYLLWGIALTQSRIAWIILPMFVVLCWKQPADSSAKISKLLLLILPIIYIAFVLCSSQLLADLGITSATVGQRAGQTSIRLVLWQQAWKMSVMRPWLGVGWYQFGPNQVTISTMFKPSEYAEYAHNIVLNFAAEIGWPLTLLLCAATLYWFYFCCIRRWNNLQVRFISLMLLAIGVHSMVEFPLWDAFFLMPLGLMVGALHTEKLGWETISINRSWIIAPVLASVIAMGVISWDYSRVVNGFVELVMVQRGQIKEGHNLNKPEWTLFPQFYDYFHIVNIKVQPAMSKEDIQFLERTSLRFGFMPVLSRLALAYAYNQRPREALRVLYVIERISPVEYDFVHTDWLGFAKTDPATFGEIAKRMPSGK